MNRTRKIITASMAWLMTVQPMLLQTSYAGAVPEGGAATVSITRSPEPRALTGALDDRSAQLRAERASGRDPATGEDGSRAAMAPLAALPVIDDALAAKLAAADQEQTHRVIIHLDYQPHATVFADVQALYQTRIDAVDRDIESLFAGRKAARNTAAAADQANYADLFELDEAQRRTLREINQRHEDLSREIRADVSTQLTELVHSYQAPVEATIADLGGEVEFTTVAGNMIVARLPAHAIAKLAGDAAVTRIVEDSLIHGFLNIADAASMVDPTDTSLSGLWDFGYDGGIYDPAIIDSGLDMNHPGMTNSASRTNYSSWYVVAGVGDASYGETCCTIDDQQGHGTHVAGIVGSYGTPAYPDYLGLAYGVEKLVTLKAGWRNASTGGASMYWSDKYNLVDRALYNTAALSPGTFADDVDGMNLSYGGSTTLDDTDGGRFWDSVISTYPDLPVTISAGNSGPSNTLFSDPAVSWNAIAVANAQDQGTTSRADDSISSSSTRGPTANGRRKPDIAAHGSSISAPNHLWETQADYVSKSGTSMAAPMVLGVIMDLMDAGLFDEKAIKAVLINTAQKNDSGINTENDADGWDPAAGWGLMNAYAAFYHRYDVFQDNLAPSGQDGDYQLYKGVMRDEGAAGEGRDRVTMVWNRHATYDPAAAPTTYYGLADLNLRLYDEDTHALLATDFDGDDNVHQVRIGAGAGDTDVVVKAYAWSASYAHGGATEAIALATEEGFTRVDLPTSFQGIAYWPSSVEPNEQFDIEFWLNSSSDIASHNNEFELVLPAGWTLINGVANQGVGSIPAGGSSAHVTYTVRAQAGVQAGVNIVVKHRHNSYAEPYGDFNWNMGLNVEVDNTAPNPNPMSFSTLPLASATDTIGMTATFASDIHNPVEYYLDYVSSPSGGSGGTDSGWQTSRSYDDTGLSTNHQYCYRSWARDNAVARNQTSPSASACAYTLQATPAGVDINLVTATSIQVASSSIPANLTLGSSGLRIDDTLGGGSSGWQQSTTPWLLAGLVPNTKHSFVARARNGDAIETADSRPASVYTLANPPAVGSVTATGPNQIQVTLNGNGNPAGTQYLIENTTAGVSSGWTSSTAWLADGLACETPYNFQARARNDEGTETVIVGLGQVSTLDCVPQDSDSDGIDDSVDNCVLVANPSQRDTDVDGYGNFCDADLNNDLIVNFGDLALFKADFLSAGDLDADFNGDGLVNFGDLVIIKAMFLNPPGPSGLAP